jgi:hypothetical protein
VNLGDDSPPPHKGMVGPSYEVLVSLCCGVPRPCDSDLGPSSALQVGMMSSTGVIPLVQQVSTATQARKSRLEQPSAYAPGCPG